MTALPLSAEILRLLEARHHDPFTILGLHPHDERGYTIRIFMPRAERVWLHGSDQPLERVPDTDLFQWRGDNQPPQPYLLEWEGKDGGRHQYYDPYCFAPCISDYDLYLFSAGNHLHAQHFLGAHPLQLDGIDGVLFATWAPNAERVSVVGDFNQWDGRCHPMRCRGGSGVWELFIPGLAPGLIYKFELRNRANGTLLLKSDPYGRSFEQRPNTAAVVTAPSSYEWRDGDWLERRRKWDWLYQPTSVYEVHLGSWRHDSQGGFLNYRQLAHQLVDYVNELGFTHIELLPVTEHPLDDSWGYQTTGYYAPTSRFGSPDDFRYFIDHCHNHGIGVILDWVPAHFPKDSHALAEFDGSPLYEHDDPHMGEHKEWGTLIFNYGRSEVRNFLISSALYWLEEFHLDGLRVDAVAAMLYLDYSRQDDEWRPNMYGGRENLEAVDFLRQLNEVCHQQQPGCLVIAEESTSWPMVSRPTGMGGLGFSMKWNMGWMNDTLEYISKAPIYRRHHHNKLTFGLLYAFSENFVLPLSHDEVVHGKASLLYKMPGDDWQRFANLRLLYCYMFSHPGKKLLFMGGEFAQGQEWNFRNELDWYVLDYPLHQGVQKLVRDLNHLYKEHRAFYRHDFREEGFEWLDCHDADQSILSYLRKAEDELFVIILNFTPVVRYDYRVGVPRPGNYEELLNSDSNYYGGSNIGNSGRLNSTDQPWQNHPHSLSLTLPPLGAVLLRYSP